MRHAIPFKGRRLSRFVRNPLEKPTLIFPLIGTAEKPSTFVGAFLLHFSGHTRVVVTAHRGIQRLHVAPNPKGTRALLIRAHEIRSAITLLHHVFNHTHRRKLMMFITLRMRPLRRFPSIYGFLEKMTGVLWTEEITTRVLPTEPKRTVLRRRSSSRFAM